MDGSPYPGRPPARTSGGASRSKEAQNLDVSVRGEKGFGRCELLCAVAGLVKALHVRSSETASDERVCREQLG